jgi:hypothetical protein
MDNGRRGWLVEPSMSNAAEYLFAPNIALADRAARKQGWHPHGRTSWIKPDGNEVHFICFEQQLAVVDKHVTVYFVGSLSPQVSRFNRKWAQLRA